MGPLADDIVKLRNDATASNLKANGFKPLWYSPLEKIDLWQDLIRLTRDPDMSSVLCLVVAEKFSGLKSKIADALCFDDYSMSKICAQLESRDLITTRHVLIRDDATHELVADFKLCPSPHACARNKSNPLGLEINKNNAHDASEHTRLFMVDGVTLHKKLDDFELTSEEYEFAAMSFMKNCKLYPRFFEKLADMWDQILFAIVKAREKSRYESFKHAINTFFVIIRRNDWGIPQGFNKVIKRGIAAVQYVSDQISKHNERKKAEIEEARASKAMLQKISEKSRSVSPSIILGCDKHNKTMPEKISNCFGSLKDRFRDFKNQHQTPNLA